MRVNSGEAALIGVNGETRPRSARGDTMNPRTSIRTAALALLLVMGGLAAAAPDRIHYQGVLRDAAGNPLDGDHDMVFRFFDAASGGSEILSDTRGHGGSAPAVAVTAGLFGVDLGAGELNDGPGPGSYSSLAEVFRDFSEVWVEIEVELQTLSPRLEVISSGFALNAEHLDGLDSTAFLTTEADPQVGAIATGGVPRFTGTTLESGTISDVGGKVGIGDPSPSFALDVSGDVNAASAYRINGNKILSSSSNNTLAGFDTGVNLSGADNTLVGAKAGQFMTTGNSNVLMGRLAGQGTSSGNSNTFVGTGAGQAANGSRNVFLGNFAGANSTGSDQLFIENSGSADPLIYGDFATDRVGIATGTPDATLDVAGDMQLDGTLTMGNPLSQNTFRWDTSTLSFRFSDDLRVDGDAFVVDQLFFGGTPEHLVWNPSGAFFLSDDLKLDAVFIEGRNAGNFEVISNSSLHLVGNVEVRTMIDDDNTGTTANAEWFRNGSFANADKLAELQEDGDFRIRKTLSQNIAFDLAESFLASEPLEPGDVVRLDPARPGAVLKSIGPQDAMVLGVVSELPGVLLGSAPFTEESLRDVWGDGIALEYEGARERLRDEVLTAHPEIPARLDALHTIDAEEQPIVRDELEQKIESLSLEQIFVERFAPVALAGRVPVKVDASFGAIRPGDPLAPSPVPGVAMKADGSAPRIGIALEELSEGTGKVLTFVDRGTATAAPEAQEAQRELLTRMLERVPDRETGTQELEGNLQVVLDAGADEQSRFSVFSDGEDAALRSEVLRVDEQGNLYLKGAVRPASMDVAEYFPVSETVEAGDVLVADTEAPGTYRRTAVAADPAVIGVVAAEPGVLLGSGIERIASVDAELAERLEEARRLGDSAAEAEIWAGLTRRFEQTHAPVALTGTVDVKVDAGFGSIRAGDLLTASPTPGHAMRADEAVPGTILGKALAPLDAGTGRVRMLVMLR